MLHNYWARINDNIRAMRSLNALRDAGDTDGRSGVCQREMLAARFGDLARCPTVLMAVTECERRGDFSRPCGAAYVNPPGAR